MEFTHQWQPSSPQPSHPETQNGVQVSGCSPSRWNPRIQFTPLNPRRNSLPPIWHNNCKLPLCRIAVFVPAWELFTKLKLPSHSITPSFHIACQKTEFRSRWFHQPKGNGRAATGTIKITFLAMYAKSGVDLTSRILHQGNLQSWALGSSLCLRTVSWLVARVSWAYVGFLATFVSQFEKKSDLPVPDKALKNCCGMCRMAGLAQAWELFTKLKLPSHAITSSWVLFWRVQLELYISKRRWTFVTWSASN